MLSFALLISSEKFVAFHLIGCLTENLIMLFHLGGGFAGDAVNTSRGSLIEKKIEILESLTSNVKYLFVAFVHYVICWRSVSTCLCIDDF